MVIALQIEPDWTCFYLTNIAFVLVLNWTHLLVLELVMASGCKVLGFGICKAGYAGHEYAMFAGILEIKQIACLH